MYHIGLWIYWLAAAIYGLFNQKARLFVAGRRGLLSSLRNTIPPDCKPVWFHCASLGEFEQGRPLIDAYRLAHPQEKILLTFFSSSGYEARKNYVGADWVYYMPLDTLSGARRFIRYVHPAKAIFIKYEFWFNHLHELKRKRIPTYVVSTIFRKEQAFFQWYGGVFRSILRCFTKIFVQNQESLDLLHSIGITRAQVCGDTRFDRVARALDTDLCPLPLKQYFSALGIEAGETPPLLIAGSTWPEDEVHLRAALERYPQLRMVLAPHEVHEGHIQQLLKLLAPYQPVLYSRHLQDGSPIDTAPRVLIIDCIGVLSSLYRFATLCYIGGGFNPSGIHNCLEAATFGKALLFGPEFRKFQEAKDLVAMGSARTYHTTAELLQALDGWLDPQGGTAACREAGLMAGGYVHSHIGATRKILPQLL